MELKDHCIANVLLVLCWLTSNVASLGQPCTFCAVQGLVAESDYRAVKLAWKYLYAQEPPAFRISFCEVSVWNSKVRCRRKYLTLSNAIQAKSRWLQKPLPASHQLDKLVRIERGNYQASVYDLRMLTNYTFSVEAEFNLQFLNHDRPQPGESAGSHHGNKVGVHANTPLNVNEFSSRGYNVTVETKGFSGKTILCLSNASEVLVHTGPYFNGKIAVEDSHDERCAVYGNQSDPLDIYALTIRHDVCGSKFLDKSRIETMIIVHENKEILTHNSRRFLVVCNFPPESYTLKASVEVPSHLIKRKKNQDDAAFISKRRNQDADPNHINIYEPFKANAVQDSRILALHQEHRILSDLTQQNKQHLDTIIAATFFAAILLSAVATLFWYTSKGSGRLGSSAMPIAVIAPTKYSSDKLNRSPFVVAALAAPSESYA